MSNKYNHKVMRTRKFVDCIETTVQIVRKDEKPIMNVDDVQELLDGLQKAADAKNDTVRILIRVMAIDGMKTIKGFTTDLLIDQFEDYYRNAVKDATKFKYFSQIEITIEKQIK